MPTEATSLDAYLKPVPSSCALDVVLYMTGWPESLPQYLNLEGYAHSFRDNTIRTPMGIGQPKARRRATAMPEVIRGTQVLTTAQLSTLQTFYETTLYDGSYRFSWKHPIHQTDRVFMFSAAPSFVPVSSGKFQLTYNFLMFPA